MKVCLMDDSRTNAKPFGVVVKDGKKEERKKADEGRKGAKNEGQTTQFNLQNISCGKSKL